MSWIKEEDMRAIRQQADIVDIMSNYLTLEKKERITEQSVRFTMITIQVYLFLQINRSLSVLYVEQEEMYLLLYKDRRNFFSGSCCQGSADDRVSIGNQYEWI